MGWLGERRRRKSHTARAIARRTIELFDKTVIVTGLTFLYVLNRLTAPIPSIGAFFCTDCRLESRSASFYPGNVARFIREDKRRFWIDCCADDTDSTEPMRYIPSWKLTIGEFKMKKLLIAGVALSALIAGPALAADLPARGPVYKGPPPVITYYSWTGCYVGINGGGSWKKTDYAIGHNNAGFFGPAFAAGATPSAYDIDDMSGGVAGGQVGCNYQTGALVFGVEADWDWANVKGSKAIDTNIAPFVAGSGIASEKLKSIGTLRGRLGGAWDRLFVYATAGLAWGQADYSYSFAFPATNELYLGTASATRTGWTAGVGGEYAFAGNLTAKVEALWYQLNGTDFIAGAQTAVGPAGVTHLVNTGKDDGWMLRAGLNWKFGGYGGY
jgi:outer membrane immunogenic protein